MRSLLRLIPMLAIGLWTITLVGAATGCGGSGSNGGGCCKMCSTGKACGDSCISRDYDYHVGADCACNAKMVANPPGHIPVVESFTYMGPAGLRYEAGSLDGRLDETVASIEIEAGRTTGLYWEHIYLGELVPPPDQDVVHFETDLKGTSCAALSLALVKTLEKLKSSQTHVARLNDLEAMGFPHLDALNAISDIKELSKHRALLSAFGVGLETYADCD